MAACARDLYDIVLPRREMCSDTTVVISYLVLRTPENLMINPHANKHLHSLFQRVDHFLHMSHSGSPRICWSSIKSLLHAGVRATRQYNMVAAGRTAR